MSDFLRPCAVAVVFNKNGHILLGDRIDTDTESWQFPQGGIEKGETPAAAAKRELYEETGIISAKWVYSCEAGIPYFFPKSVKEKMRQKNIATNGQNLYFSLFYFDGNDAEINLTTHIPEFKSYCWADFDFAVKNIIYFKKEAYQQAAQLLKPKIERYIGNIIQQ